jgi:RNA 3'-terminal phosphate cyclase (ATP)
MLTLDGSMGEGGGQVLRSSLALSMVTGTAFRLVRVRAGRSKPGLLRQHLTALRAAAMVSGAEVSGAELGSAEVTFRPGALRAGAHRVAIGSAGSTSLVLQTVLLPLLHAPGPSTITVEGGTHNPSAPCFDYLATVYVPALAEMGARATLTMARPGFYPAGGGEVTATVEPSALGAFHREARGALRSMTATAMVAAVPGEVAQRELAVLGARFGSALTKRPLGLAKAYGPGNAVLLAVECEGARELFAAYGEKGIAAERVAAQVADEAEAWLASEAPVGEHLADQMLLPMALGGGGRFVTVAPTMHSRTHADVIARFTGARVRFEALDARRWVVEVTP